MSEHYESIVKREQKVFMPSVRRWPLALARGKGSRVWDVDGNEFIDMTAGWGVTSIGHCHPALVEAISTQASTLIQTTNVVYTEAQLDLAEQLIESNQIRTRKEHHATKMNYSVVSRVLAELPLKPSLH